MKLIVGQLAGLLIKVGVPLAKIFLAPWATMGSASAIVATIWRKMHGPGVVRAEK